MAQRLYRIFAEAGMAKVRIISNPDTYAYVYIPYIPDGAPQNIDSFYNFISSDFQENIGIDIPEASVWSNKVGWFQIKDMAAAAYLLLELESTTPCVAGINGMPCYTEKAIGWLNYLFDEEYTLEKHSVWRIIETLYMEFGNECDIRSYAKDMIVKSSELKKEKFLSAYWVNKPKDIEDIIEIIKFYFKKIQDENGLKDEGMGEYVIDFICSLSCENKEQKARECSLLTYLLDIIPPQLVLRIAADTYGFDFWKTWFEIKDSINFEAFDMNKEYSPVKKVTTEGYLGLDRDDYLFMQNIDEVTDAAKKYIDKLKSEFRKAKSEKS